MRKVRTQRNALFATAKEIAFIGLMAALLIACQLALSGLQGIEVVTVLFLAFCYSFGVVRGVIVANCFSLLRCLIWGFFPYGRNPVSRLLQSVCRRLRADRRKTEQYEGGMAHRDPCGGGRIHDRPFYPFGRCDHAPLFRLQSACGEGVFL